MKKLRAWVNRHQIRRLTSKEQPTGQLPFLPLPRRSITPPTTWTSAQECLFFQLPYEIRRMILLIAFGGRTVHMDIIREEEAWQWKGIVCAREFLPRTRFNRQSAWNDDCMRWWARRGWGTLPEVCHLGITGFLLSCRQGYIEGIDVLYSANCISINNETLLIHLPQLIPFERLASITSFELVVTAHRIQEDNGGKSFNIDHVKPILDNVATHFQHLRSLCISFITHSYGHEILDGPALSLVDEFYRCRQLRHMKVDIPARDFSKMHKNYSVDELARAQPPITAFGILMWRSLDGEVPEVQRRTVDRYPYPPYKLPAFVSGDRFEESAGYWLAEGDVGPQLAICRMCGTTDS